MRAFAVLLLGCCLLCGGRAGAEVVDFSKITCKQFYDTHKGDVSVILAWLSGYSREENDPPIFDTDTVEANGKKLSAYCAANPNVGVITATDKLFGK